MTDIIVATGNPHKVEEFDRILSPLGYRVRPQSAVCPGLVVEETGATFAANARLKAEGVFRLTGLPAIADDSGLCVNALGGRPGVYSARYGGDNASYPDKMAMLLHELESVPQEKRLARFVSAICCVMGENDIIECEGVCEGKIAFTPSGSSGFGYDPIFLVDDISFAALSGEKKDQISHRGRALRQFCGIMAERRSR